MIAVRVVLLAALLGTHAGCSAFLVEGPAPVSARAPTCDGPRWARIDAIVAVTAVVGSVATLLVLDATYEGEDSDGRWPAVVAGVGAMPTGLGFAASSVFGYRRASACDEAWELWRARHSGGSLSLPQPPAAGP